MEKEIAEVLFWLALAILGYVGKSVLSFFIKISKEKSFKTWRESIGSEVTDLLKGVNGQISLLNDKLDALSNNLHEEMGIQNKKIDLLNERIDMERSTREEFEEKVTVDFQQTRQEFRETRAWFQGTFERWDNLISFRKDEQKPESTDPPPNPLDPDRPPQGPGN